jgi:hypothetical protein
MNPTGSSRRAAPGRARLTVVVAPAALLIVRRLRRCVPTTLAVAAGLGLWLRLTRLTRLSRNTGLSVTIPAAVVRVSRISHLLLLRLLLLW